MLRRHLPLAPHDPECPGKLPIVGVVVGPSRHKEISKVSVADLLRTKCYPKLAYDNVRISAVPFQAF
jgi:hypothetical protein